ncbi:MAG: gamma-glutamyl-gamma-aminobutyrate hydrolase family protein [Chloroflexi bacterium]|nr:gamma-glutamyl-gamma-aminobutyrate hydrolase family protein [Chloroflexota bacterium]
MTPRLPIIGVPASRKEESGYTFHHAGEPYLRAIEEAGGCPVLLPVTGSAASVSCVLALLDGMFLPGGGDVAPVLYGKKQTIAMGVDQPTDEFEINLCRQALEADLPILAVCRGIQVLNVALGGTLIQDIPTEINTAVTHRQAASRETCTHGIKVDSESRLARILGSEEFCVNSFHHQAVDKLGDGLKAAAWSSEDGIIEAIEAPDRRFVIGVQFHPEEICHSVRPSADLLSALIEEALRSK